MPDGPAPPRGGDCAGVPDFHSSHGTGKPLPGAAHLPGLLGGADFAPSGVARLCLAQRRAREASSCSARGARSGCKHVAPRGPRAPHTLQSPRLKSKLTFVKPPCLTSSGPRWARGLGVGTHIPPSFQHFRTSLEEDSSPSQCSQLALGNPLATGRNSPATRLAENQSPGQPWPP